MRDHDLLDADRARLAHERDDLPGGDMRGADDRAVLRGQLEHLLDLGPELAVGVLDPDALGLLATALLGVVSAGAAVYLGVVARVDGGHPYFPAAQTQCCLDR